MVRHSTLVCQQGVQVAYMFVYLTAITQIPQQIQILCEAGMLSSLEEELMQHMCYVMLDTANKLQRWATTRSAVTVKPQQPSNADHCKEFAKQMLKSTISLPLPQVSRQILLVCVLHTHTNVQGCAVFVFACI